MSVFEQEVERYDRWFEKNAAVYASEVAAVRALLPERGRGLEVGTGTGRFSIPFGIEDGVEPAKAMRERAIQQGLKVLDASAEALPFPDQSFDFVLLVTTICFVQDPALAMREAWRVLRLGGSLVVGFVDRQSRIGKQYESRKSESPFYREASFFSVDEVKQQMKCAGFKEFKARQTLFKSLDKIADVEPVREGSGEGGFVVLSGIRR